MQFYIGYKTQRGETILANGLLELLLANGLFDLYNNMCEHADIANGFFTSTGACATQSFWDAMVQLFGVSTIQVEVGRVALTKEITSGTTSIECAEWFNSTVATKISELRATQGKLFIYPKYAKEEAKSQLPAQQKVMAPEEVERAAVEAAAREAARKAAEEAHKAAQIAAEEARKAEELRKKEEEMARKKKETEQILSRLEVDEVVPSKVKLSERRKTLSKLKPAKKSADDVLAEILNGTTIPETAVKTIASATGVKLQNATHLAWKSNMSLINDSVQPLLVQFIDKLYPSSETAQTAGEALELAVKAIEELMFADPVYIVDKRDAYASKSIFDADSKFTLQVNQSGSDKKNIAMSIKFSEDVNAPVSFNNITLNGSKDTLNLEPAEKISRLFIKGLMKAETLIPTILKVVSPNQKDTLTPLLKQSFEGILNTQLKWNSGGELTELPQELDGEDDALLDNACNLYRNIAAGYPLLALQVYNNLVKESTATDVQFQAAVASAFIYEVLLRILPVISAFLVKMLSSVIGSLAHAAFSGDSQIDNVEFTHGISSEGPHIKFDLEVEGAVVTVATPLALMIEQMKTSASFGNVKMILKKQARLFGRLMVSPVSKLAGLPKTDKLFILFDCGSPKKSNMFAILESLSARKEVEAAYKLAIDTLSEQYFVITRRIPLSPEHIDAESIVGNKPTACSVYKHSLINTDAIRNSSRQIDIGGMAHLINTDTADQVDGIVNHTLKPGKSSFGEYEVLLNSPVIEQRSGFTQISPCSVIFAQRDVLSTPGTSLTISGTKTQWASVNSTGSGQYVFLPKLTSQQLSRLSAELTSKGTKVAVCDALVRSQHFFGEPSYQSLKKALIGETGDNPLTIEGRLAWHDVGTVETLRNNPAYRSSTSESVYLMAILKDNIIYFGLPLGYSEGFIEAAWIKMCAFMRDVNTLGTEAQQATGFTEVNYVPNEYSDKHKKARKDALAAEKKQVMTDLKKRRDDYQSALRAGMKKLKGTRKEIVQFKRTDGTMSEETQLKDLIERGYLEGFRLVGDQILVKTSEVSIYESFLIYKLGKFLIKIQGFSGGRTFAMLMYNLTSPKITPGETRLQDHPHVRDGVACYGNLGDMLNEAITNHDLMTLIMLAKSYLGTVNVDDTYGRTLHEHWQGILPTIHNIIKFGVVGNMEKAKGVIWTNPKTGLIEATTFGKIKYDDICKEYERVKPLILDQKSRSTDITYDQFMRNTENLPAAAIIGPRCRFEVSMNHIRTQRTKEQIQLSIEDFENTIRSRDHWNKYIRRVGGKRASKEGAEPVTEPGLEAVAEDDL